MIIKYRTGALNGYQIAMLEKAGHLPLNVDEMSDVFMVDDQKEKLLDKYFCAALSGLLSGSTASKVYASTVARAFEYAREGLKQRDQYIMPGDENHD